MDKILEAYEEMLNEETLSEGSAKDLQWLNRHVGGLNIRLTALFGLDSAYTDNKNFKKIKQIMKQLKSITDELRTAIIDEMKDEKLRQRSR